MSTFRGPDHLNGVLTGDGGRQVGDRPGGQWIVLRAQEEAERLAASENVVRMANDRADAIVSTAEERAGALRRGADEYSDRSLAFLEAEISRLAEQVRAGREVLAGRLGGAQQGEERERAQEPSRRFAGWSVDPTASR